MATPRGRIKSPWVRVWSECSAEDGTLRYRVRQVQLKRWNVGRETGLIIPLVGHHHSHSGPPTRRWSQNTKWAQPHIQSVHGRVLCHPVGSPPSTTLRPTRLGLRCAVQCRWSTARRRWASVAAARPRGSWPRPSSALILRCAGDKALQFPPPARAPSWLRKAPLPCGCPAGARSPQCCMRSRRSRITPSSRSRRYGRSPR